MKKIYICHPLGGDGSPEWGDLERNMERYLLFVAMATNAGDVVITRAHHYMTHTRGLTNGDHAFYLDRDVKLLEDADEVWMAGPVSVSKGMKIEEDAALGFGIPVIHKDEWDDPEYMPEAA